MHSRLATSKMTSRHAYLESHPSINASMSDFEQRDFSPTVPEMPSQHSGFRSRNASEYSETSSQRSYSPPAWRKSGSGWFKHQLEPSPTRTGFVSKETSPLYHSADEEGDATEYRTATRIPLPASPVKGRSPTNTPEPATNAGAHEGDEGGGEATRMSPAKPHVNNEPSPMGAQSSTESNYIRFTGTVAVQQRTDAIETFVVCVRKAIRHITKSHYNTVSFTLGSLLITWLCVNLFSQPTNGPVPDLIKVVSLANAFEPVMFYSENGHEQIGELQETGVAVWDLGESVRNTNMTSAPIIVSQLEDLSESLKALSHEMTSFFNGLDADVDNILFTMEWARRELSTLTQQPQGRLSSLWSNAHTILTRTGIIGDDSQLIKGLVGQTFQQHARTTLERAFNEFLNVMEASIQNELSYSTQILTLFDAVDKQFLNLHRTVIREQDQQERIEADFLSSLWTKVIGVNASKLRKYEKNRDLLQSVRDRTVHNKHVLVEHNQRLQQLKSKLENLRRQLVGPLLRGTNSTTQSVEDQIMGLEGTYRQLKSVRDTQKQKTMALMFGARERRDDLQLGRGARIGVKEIEGRTR